MFFLSKKRLAAVAVALGATASASLYLFSSPVDLVPYYGRIEPFLEKKTGLRITADSASLTVRTSALISLSGVKVLKEKEELLSAKTLRVKVPLLSLLAFSPAAESVEMESVRLFLRRGKTGNLNIAGLFGGAGRGNAALSLKRASVKDGFVRYTDEVTGAVFDAEGVNAHSIRKGERLEYTLEASVAPSTKLRLSGTAGAGKNGLAIAGSGGVEGVDLSRFNAYLKGNFSASVYGSSSAMFSYRYDNGLSLKGALKYKRAEIIAKRLLAAPIISRSGYAAFDFTSSDNAFEATLSKVRLLMDGFAVSGSLKVSGGASGEKSARLKLETTAVPIVKALSFVPYRVLSKALAQKAGEVKALGGEVTVKNLSLTGAIDEIKSGAALEKPGALALEAFLSGVSIKYAGFAKEFSGITGAVGLRDNTAFLSGVSGGYGESRIERADAAVSDPFNTARYSISLKASLESAEALDLSKKLLERQRGGFAPRLFTAEALGRAILSFEARGSLKDIKNSKFSGTLGMKGVSVYGPDLPLELKEITGAARFDNDRVVLKDVQLKDPFNTALRINGEAAGYGAVEPTVNINAEGGLSWATLGALKARGFLKGKFIDGLTFDGLIPFRISLVRKGELTVCDAFVDLTPVSLAHGNAVKKAAGFPATLDGSITFNSKELIVRRAGLAFGSSHVNASGRASFDASAYDLSLSSAQVRIDDLDDVVPYLVNEVSSSGALSFDVKIKKAAGESFPSYEGKAELKDGRFTTAFLSKPVERVNARVVLTGNALYARLDNLSAGRTEISGHLNVPDIAGRVVEFEVNSPSFYSDDIFKKPDAGRAGATSKTRKFLSDLLEGQSEGAQAKRPVITGSGMVRSAKGSVFNQTFEDLNVELSADTEAVRARRIAFKKNGGAVSGALVFYRDPSARLFFSADLNAKDVQLEPFFIELGAKSKILSGGLNVEASLDVTRRAPSFAGGMNGRVHFNSRDGRLWKFVVLSKIFSIVNIISINELFEDGLPYSLLAGDFEVKSGIIKTQNLHLDSSALRMSGTGEINLPDGNMNGYLGMHPFVTIDKIVTSVPLAGWIIGGRQKSAISMYYEITGPLKGPDVEPVPVKGLGKGVFEMLQRLLEAPVELISPGKDSGR